jgi:hypothetical protein
VVVTLVVIPPACVFGLVFVGAPLSRKHELITHRLKSRLVQLVVHAVELTAHLLILRLQQRDMLMRRLLVVKKPTNPRVLLIFNNFFLQYLQLKLHKVDLLLQVLDIRISDFFLPVGVSASLQEHVGILTDILADAFILPVEVHVDRARVAIFCGRVPESLERRFLSYLICEKVKNGCTKLKRNLPPIEVDMPNCDFTKKKTRKEEQI